MAQKVSVLLIDDVDGGEADETLLFGVEGVQYEIDLSTRNADKLRDALAKWTQYARKVKGSKPAPALNGASRAPKELKRTAVPDARRSYTLQERKWIQLFARENGYQPPSDMGRIAYAVSAAWEEAGRPKGKASKG